MARRWRGNRSDVPALAVTATAHKAAGSLPAADTKSTSRRFTVHLHTAMELAKVGLGDPHFRRDLPIFRSDHGWGDPGCPSVGKRRHDSGVGR